MLNARRSGITGRLALAALALSLSAGRTYAQTADDVPATHWAYAAVQDLAAKGLIKGYPPSGKFFGGRTVTRYEMATIVQRVLARVDELLAQKADKGARAEAVVSPAQLDEIRRLVDDFKVELTVIKTDMQKVHDQIGELKTDVGILKTDVNALKDQVGKNTQAIGEVKQGVQGAIDAIHEQAGRVDKVNATLTSHRISGYIQARFESFDTGRTSLFTPTASGGTGQTPTNGGPVVGGPWYGFLARRVRLKVSGPIGSSGRTDYGIQIDTPSFAALNLREAYINVAGPIKNGMFSIGQFVPPFGWELPVSSAVRESPERALGFTDSNASSFIWKTAQSATGGVVTPGSVISPFINQEGDQGAMFSWGRHGTSLPGSLGTKFYLMALNGGGTTNTGIRNLKNGIDWIARAQTTTFKGKLDAGVSGYYGQIPVRGAPPVAGVPVAFVNGVKELAGVDLNYRTPWKTTLRAEYVGGVYEVTPDRALILENNHMQAWYLAARHPLTKKLELGAKYEEFMPISQAGKTAGGLGRMDLIRKAAHIGLLYSIDEATRIRLWYVKGLTPYDPSVPSGPMRSRLGFLTGELQVRF